MSKRTTSGSWIRVSVGHRPLDNNSIDTRLFSSTNDNDINSRSSPNTTNKRRKRKDGKNVVSSQKDTTASATTTTSSSIGSTNNIENRPSMSPTSIQEKDAPKQVTMQIMDVRDVVSGKSTMNPPSNPVRSNTYQNDTNRLDDNVTDDDNDDDEEYEYYYEDENGNEIVLDTVKSVSSSTSQKTPISSFTSSSSSLDDILADARRLRQEQKDAIASGAQDPEELSIPKLLKGAISNIVTVDFFLVCGLLAWFLAGIFCSYVLKDDTVQIAFNMQFERVVQPALGILMIGAAAGAVFKEPNEDEK